MKQVTAAIIVRKGTVLLTRRKDGEALAGFWEFPGGKVEEGETPQECLQRELNEELGLTTVAGILLAECTYHYDHGSFNLIALKTELISGEPKLTVHDKAEWVNIDDLESYNLAPADKLLVHTIRKVLKNV